jgi:hypothetical protein
LDLATPIQSTSTSTKLLTNWTTSGSDERQIEAEADVAEKNTTELATLWNSLSIGLAKHLEEVIKEKGVREVALAIIEAIIDDRWVRQPDGQYISVVPIPTGDGTPCGWWVYMPDDLRHLERSFGNREDAVKYASKRAETDAMSSKRVYTVNFK